MKNYADREECYQPPILHIIRMPNPIIVLLFIQNISPFLTGLNAPANSSSPATVDQTQMTFDDISKMYVDRWKKSLRHIAMVAKFFKKENSHRFKLLRCYSVSFNLSNVGEIFCG